MNNKLSVVKQKTFLDLCAATHMAREWMSTQAPASDWANRVRVSLHEAHRAAVSEETALSERDFLELAAQTESLLNLYMAAKKELHMATGVSGIDVSKFPIVETIRAQIKAVRNNLGKGE